jgi:4-hydroxy-L-threonine phosphate dehydrogenase PdxA
MTTRTRASMVYPGKRGRIQDRTGYPSLSGRGCPLPANTLFFRAGRGDFDIVVAMYHDQGHGPVKALGIESGVNI